MKKIFSKLILPIMALGLFAACDDVPSPYYVLNPEDAEYELQGEGTADSPYTVGDALFIINSGTYTSSPVFVEGIITQIDGIDTGYGNATYYIASESDINEDGSVKQQLEVYRGYYLNGDRFTSEDQLKVGDHVIVYGQITLYGSTPEVTQGSMLYEHNGEYAPNPVSDVEPAGKGTKDDPFNVAAAQQLCSQLGPDVQSGNVYVKGIVVSVKEQYSTQFGNATFYISDDGTASGQFYVFRALYLGNQKYTSGELPKEGDEVVIYGKLINYKGNTPETVQNEAFLYSLNGKSEGGDEPGPSGEPSGDGTLQNPYNSVAANNLANSLAADEKSDIVYIKGKVASIKENYDNQWGNATFYISDDGTTSGQLYVFQAFYLGNQKYTSGDLLKVGDDVVICGKLTNYRGNTPETLKGETYLYSLNGKTAGGDEPGPSGEAKGDGSLQNPYNSVAANQVCAAMSADEKTGEVYVKGKIVSISQNYDYNNKQFGNITCYISDNGQSTDQFCIWRALYFNNEKYTEGTLPKVGDEVIFYGKLTNYRGNTPETVQNEAYLYSLNGQTSGEGGGDDPAPQPSEGEGSGTASSPYNVVAAQSVFNTSGAATNAYVIGYAVGYVDGNGLNEGTATFDIPSANETEILIADSPNETDWTKCLPVQLPKGAVREGLDLYANKALFHQQVLLYGSIEKYFGVAGLKSTSYGKWSGGEVGTAPAKRRR